jgi:hypothetical protein
MIYRKAVVHEIQRIVPLWSPDDYFARPGHERLARRRNWLDGGSFVWLQISLDFKQTNGNPGVRPRESIDDMLAKSCKKTQ